MKFGNPRVSLTELRFWYELEKLDSDKWGSKYYIVDSCNTFDKRFVFYFIDGQQYYSISTYTTLTWNR